MKQTLVILAIIVVGCTLGLGSLGDFAPVATVLAQAEPHQNSNAARPRMFRATVVDGTRVLLQWRPVASDVLMGRYEIGVASALEPATQPVGTVPALSGDQFLVENLEPGTIYRFAVRAVLETDSGDRAGPTSFTYATTLSEAERTLLLIYFPADNDLSPYVDSVLQRIRRGSLANPNVVTRVLVDRWGPDNTTVYSIEQGTITPTDAVEAEWGRGELDTTDPAVLSWFLEQGRAEIDAARTVVSFMGHGTGLLPEADFPVTGPPELPPSADGIPALPRGIEATPGDVGDGSAYMSTVALGQALAAATDNGANPFDLIFFDQCFQGNLDVLYEVHPYAEVFVASPNYAWLSAPYHFYLPAFAPTATPEFMGQVILSVYQRSLNNAHPNSIFWVSGADIPVIAGAVDQLADALLNALDDRRGPAIYQSAQAAQYVDTTQCGRGQYSLEPPDEKLGAASLATQLAARFPAGDAYGVHTASQNLLDTLATVQTESRTGRPYLDPGALWEYTDSLTILAPLARTVPATVAWRASTYTRTLPLEANWPGLDTPVQVTAVPAYVETGRWADFLAEWYTGPLNPTFGEWCLYTPPPQVNNEELLDLSLTVTPLATAPDGNSGTVRLSWSTEIQSEAERYWVFARRVETDDRRLVATVEGDTTSLELTLPTATAYEFQVGIQDELGLRLGQSNPVVYTHTSPPVSERVYLPFLDRN